MKAPKGKKVEGLKITVRPLNREELAKVRGFAMPGEKAKPKPLKGKR